MLKKALNLTSHYRIPCHTALLITRLSVCHRIFSRSVIAIEIIRLCSVETKFDLGSCHRDWSHGF